MPCFDALGAVGDPGDFPRLTEFLDDPDPRLQAAARSAIRAIQTRHGAGIPREPAGEPGGPE